MPANNTEVFAGSLSALLDCVAELMLYPRLAMREFPSLNADKSLSDAVIRRTPWLPVASVNLRESLSAGELDLRVSGLFETRTANVYLSISSREAHFGFLTTSQAQPLL